MPLTEHEASKLQDMLNLIIENRPRLSKWEDNFFFGEDEEWPGVATQLLKKNDAIVTDRMWTIIERVYWKVTH